MNRSAPVFSLDELRMLEAVHTQGSITGAATWLGRGHTGVLYAMASLERSTGLKLLDRTGHRVVLTQRGLAFLHSAQQVLEAQAALTNRIAELRNGWEPRFVAVADGIVSIEPIINAFASLTRLNVPTTLRFDSAFLSGVEAAFEQGPADVMISVLPPTRHSLFSHPLPPIEASLVTHRSHPLAGRRVSLKELSQHMLLTVHGSDPRLHLPTAALEGSISAFHLNDFGSKKLALMKGFGFGWMPNADIAQELKRGQLVKVKWSHASTHTFEPRLYHRGERRLGPAARHFIEAVLEASRR